MVTHAGPGHVASLPSKAARGRCNGRYSCQGPEVASRMLNRTQQKFGSFLEAPLRLTMVVHGTDVASGDAFFTSGLPASSDEALKA